MPAGSNAECLHCRHRTIGEARGVDLANNIKTHKEKGREGRELEKQKEGKEKKIKEPNSIQNNRFHDHRHAYKVIICNTHLLLHI